MEPNKDIRVLMEPIRLASGDIGMLMVALSVLWKCRHLINDTVKTIRQGRGEI